MPQIIPIRDLKNTNELSRMCKESTEPIFVTKNGYGEMVIMSMELYEQRMFLLDAYAKLENAEQQVREGRTMNASDGLKSLREKYHV